MASPWKHAVSGWYVSVVLPSRRRAQIYLGQVTKAQAAKIAGYIESMRVSNARGVAHPPEVQQWSDRIEPKMRERLCELGLIRSPAVRLDWRVGEWFDHYIKSRADFKPNTIKGFKTAKKAAVSGLGDMLLCEITVAQARQYARNLASAHSSEHASKLVERAKQAFDMACESRILLENPFRDVVLQSKPDKNRQFYVDKATADVVSKVCPHEHAAAVFALARWCGLRIPHEVLALEWTHVDFESNRLTVPGGTKTGSRVLPLFPPAREAIKSLRAVTPLDSIHVLDRARGSAATTWREWLTGAIAKAGVYQWEKLWINLRASCRTDLEARFPSHVCDAWLGHSHRVAKDHYLMVTPEDWEAANVQ